MHITAQVDRGLEHAPCGKRGVSSGSLETCGSVPSGALSH